MAKKSEEHAMKVQAKEEAEVKTEQKPTAKKKKTIQKKFAKFAKGKK